MTQLGILTCEPTYPDLRYMHVGHLSRNSTLVPQLGVEIRILLRYQQGHITELAKSSKSAVSKYRIEVRHSSRCPMKKQANDWNLGGRNGQPIRRQSGAIR